MQQHAEGREGTGRATQLGGSEVNGIACMQNACGEGSFFSPVSKHLCPCGKDTGLQGLSGARVAVCCGLECALPLVITEPRGRCMRRWAVH